MSLHTGTFPDTVNDIRQRHRFMGAGEDGQLGVGSRHEKHIMLPVSDLDGLDVASVVAGSRNSLAICTTGEVSSEGTKRMRMTS